MKVILLQDVKGKGKKGQMLKGRAISVSAQQESGGVVVVHADCDGLIQKFIFTPV